MQDHEMDLWLWMAQYLGFVQENQLRFHFLTRFWYSTLPGLTTQIKLAGCGSLPPSHWPRQHANPASWDFDRDEEDEVAGSFGYGQAISPPTKVELMQLQRGGTTFVL